MMLLATFTVMELTLPMKCLTQALGLVFQNIIEIFTVAASKCFRWKLSKISLPPTKSEATGGGK
jgi:hypothetical protein